MPVTEQPVSPNANVVVKEEAQGAEKVYSIHSATSQSSEIRHNSPLLLQTTKQDFSTPRTMI